MPVLAHLRREEALGRRVHRIVVLVDVVSQELAAVGTPANMAAVVLEHVGRCESTSVHGAEQTDADIEVLGQADESEIATQP